MDIDINVINKYFPFTDVKETQDLSLARWAMAWE